MIVHEYRAFCKWICATLSEMQQNTTEILKFIYTHRSCCRELFLCQILNLHMSFHQRRLFVQCKCGSNVWFLPDCTQLYTLALSMRRILSFWLLHWIFLATIASPPCAGTTRTGLLRVVLCSLCSYVFVTAFSPLCWQMGGLHICNSNIDLNFCFPHVSVE